MTQNSPSSIRRQGLTGFHRKFLWPGFLFFVMLCLASPVLAEYPIKVVNNCKMKLFIRAGTQDELNPVALAPKAAHTYTVNAPWNSGRVYGCWDDTSALGLDFFDINMQKHCALIEPTVTSDAGAVNVDISYVDFITIPARMEVLGCTAGNPVSYCDSSDPTIPTKCRVTARHTVDELKGCPTALFGKGRSCQSSYHLCEDKPDHPICSKFKNWIHTCAGNPSKYPGCEATAHLTTKDVYGCDDFFGTDKGKPYCAEMNRGVFGRANKTKFYAREPYNDYAKWVHHITGDIYAFPYDDVGDRGGDLGCQTSKGLIITFCPLSKKVMRAYLGDSRININDYDIDVYRFEGMKGEEVIIRLENTDTASGGASLMIMGPALVKTASGNLPQLIDTILPSTGTYTVYVSNITGTNRYAGPYHISIKSSGNAYTRFRAGSSVEISKNASSH